MTSTDQHRQRVYDAEEAAFGGTTLHEPLEWAELTTVFAALVHHPWWRHLDVPAPELRPARSDSSRSSADGSVVRISPLGQTPLTIAHEVAHHLVMGLAHTAAGASLVGPHHGPGFRAAELRTVAVVGGSWAREALAAEWTRRGLRPAPWAWPEPDAGEGRAFGGVIALGAGHAVPSG